MSMGVNVYGPLYYTVATTVAIIIAGVLFAMWRSYAKKCRLAWDSGKKELIPSPVFPAVVSTIAVGAFICVAILSWGYLQSQTNSRLVDRSNPAESKELKAVEQMVAPTEAEKDQTVDALKQRVEIKHEKALDSFDKSMEKEDSGIQQRTKANGPTSGKSN